MFKKPVPLSKNDIELTLSPLKNYKHAMELNAVALNYQEMIHASKFYPIFFSKDGEDYIPFALLGFEENSNLFIDKKSSQWVKDHYVPLVVRLYPFSLAKIKNNEAETISVVYDKDCDGFDVKKHTDGFKILDSNGDTSERGKNIISALEENLKAMNYTKDLLKMISEMGLLRSVNVDIGEKENKKFEIQNLIQVDSEKLNQLKDEDLLKLTKSSALHLIYNHLDSYSNFTNLLNRVKK
jgi:hypothetical protein